MLSQDSERSYSFASRLAADTICPGETTPTTVTTAISIAKKFLNFFCIRIPLFPNRYSLYLRKFPATHNAGKKRMFSRLMCKKISMPTAYSYPQAGLAPDFPYEIVLFLHAWNLSSSP